MSESDALTNPRPKIEATPAMARFIGHFAELGPRWGLERETCRAHALLFLVGQAMSVSEIARALNLGEGNAAAAVADLEQWGMAQFAGESRWYASGEPWDLLFAALDARRRRELEPALEMLRACRQEAAVDGTPGEIRQRLGRVQELVEDLAAIDVQARRLPVGAVVRLVGLGGRAARFLARAFPQSHGRRR